MYFLYQSEYCVDCWLALFTHINTSAIVWNTIAISIQSYLSYMLAESNFNWTIPFSLISKCQSNATLRKPRISINPNKFDIFSLLTWIALFYSLSLKLLQWVIFSNKQLSYKKIMQNFYIESKKFSLNEAYHWMILWWKHCIPVIKLHQTCKTYHTQY